MRVKEADVEDKSRYRYFAGTKEEGTPIFSEDVKAAIDIIESPVGEFSIAFNDYLGSYIMTACPSGEGAVQIREGLTPWGPWSTDPIEVCDKSKYPGMYAAFTDEKFNERDGQDIYFSLSRWGPYNVFWMKTTLI